MKKILLSLLVLSFAYSDSIGQIIPDSSFYYFKGGKIFLRKVEGYVYAETCDSILFNGTKHASSVEVNNRINGGKLKKSIGNSEFDSDEEYQSDIQTFPCYAVNNDTLGLSDVFYVKLKNLSDTLRLKQYAEVYKARIVQQNKYMPLWFMMSCTKESVKNSIDLANLFYESGLFQCAEPEFMDRLKSCCVNDPRFNKQWNLCNTGQDYGTAGIDIQMCDAWNLSTGKDIIVGILDRGIATHRDLPNLYPLSHDTGTGGDKIVREEHGTAVAGIVGAIRNNGFGNAGVAPDCKLMDVSIEDAGMNGAYQGVDAILWAMEHGAQVLNCSWVLLSESEFFEDAVETAVSKGRNGLGCIIVFASGNRAHSSVEYPSSLPGVISVGAIDRGGYRSGCSAYLSKGCEFWDKVSDANTLASSYGINLHVVAPGTFVPSLHYQNNAFYSGCGTSFAAPHVTGIAALMLAVNPNLSSEEVRSIICATCTKLPEYSFSSLHPYGAWNREVGYGLVNACQAVKVAEALKGISIAAEFPYLYKLNRQIENMRVVWKSVSNDFVIKNQTDSTVNLIAKDYGKTTILTAKVYCNNVLVKELTKNVSSALTIEGVDYISCCGREPNTVYVPYQATCSWNVSDNVEIDSQKDGAIRVSKVKGTSAGYWIEAVVKTNGKTYKKKKNLLLRYKASVEMWAPMRDDRGRYSFIVDPMDNNGCLMWNIPEATTIVWDCKRTKNSGTTEEATLETEGRVGYKPLMDYRMCLKSSTVKDSISLGITTFAMNNEVVPVYPPIDKPFIPTMPSDLRYWLRVTLPNSDYEGIVTCAVYDDCTSSTVYQYLINSTGVTEYANANDNRSDAPVYRLVSPNPATSLVSVRRTEMNGLPLQTVKLMLYNDYGLVRSIDATTEEEILQMDVSGLTEGTYYLNVVLDSNKIIRQILRIKH